MTNLIHVLPLPIQLNDETDDSCVAESHPHHEHISNVHIDDATIIRSENGSKYTAYTIIITLSSGEGIKINKRYSEFEELGRKLRKIYPDRLIEIPSLPPKKYIGNNFSVSFLNKRRKGLEYFINSVLLNPVFNGSDAVKRFIASGN